MFPGQPLLEREVNVQELVMLPLHLFFGLQFLANLIHLASRGFSRVASLVLRVQLGPAAFCLVGSVAESGFLNQKTLWHWKWKV